MRLGSKIREARKDAGFTQKELAEILSVDRSMVISYEKERYSIPWATLESLAKAVGKPLAWFFLEEDQDIVTKGSNAPTPREALAVLAELVESAEQQQAGESREPRPSYRVRNQAFETAKETRGKKAEKKSG